MQKLSRKLTAKTLGFLLIPVLFLFFSTPKAGAVVGLSVGNDQLNLTGGQNVFYGVTSASNTAGSFLLLEKGYGNVVFKIDYAGNITTNGSVLGANNYWGFSGNNLFASSTAWNVGIGTTSPYSKLHLFDNTTGPIISLSGLNTNYRGLTVKDTGNSEQWFSGANNVNNFVIRRSGTTDNLTIASTTGYVGIGTTVPGTRFVVDSGTDDIYIQDNTINTGYDYNGIRSLWLNYNGYQNASSQFRDLKIGNGKTAALVFVEGSTGNVGIGTTNPSAKLDVASQYSDISLQEGNPGNSSSAYPYLALNNTNTNANYKGSVLRFQKNSTNLWGFGSDYAGNGSQNFWIYDYVVNQPRLLIDSSGNVGIGSTTPNIKLSVSNGSTGNVIDVGGANIGGLASTPTNPDQAVPLGYLQNNYNATSTSLWSGSLAGNISNANSGNVGIGTTNPERKLTIVGPSSVPGDQGGTLLITDGTGINTDHKLQLGIVSNSYAWIQSIKPGTNVLPLILNPSGGYVGIGTTAPKEKLDLAGSLSANGGNIILGTYNSTVSRYLGIGSGTTGAFGANSGFQGLEFGPAQGASEGYIAFHTHDFGVSSGERVRIDKSGNVGIGTTAPGALMHLYSTNSSFGNPTLILENYGNNRYLSTIAFKGRSSGTDVNKYTTSQIVGGFEGGDTWADSIIGFNVGFSQPRAMTIKGNGSVGIGSTTPNIKLSVSNGSTGNVIDVGGANIGGLASTPTNPDQAVPLGYLQNNYNATSTSLWSGSLAGNISNANSGNVGIGTTNPGAKLEVNGNGKFVTAGVSLPTVLTIGGNGNSYTNADLVLEANSTDSDYRGIGTFLYQKTSQKEWFIGQPYGTSDSLIIARKTGVASHDNSVAQTLNALITILNSGNVGIGTTAPIEKLEILGGNIRTNGNGQGIYLNQGTLSANDSASIIYNGNGNLDISPRINFSSVFTRGNVGIGSTTPNIKLSVSNGSTGNVIDVGGANIGGLASTPTNRDQAIPLGYLQDNYTSTSTINSTLFWSGSLAGNISNANSGNVGIGTTSPVTVLDVIAKSAVTTGTGIKVHGLTGGSGRAIAHFDSTYAVANDRYVLRVTSGNETYENLVVTEAGNVGIGTTIPYAKLEVNGGDVYIWNNGNNPRFLVGDSASGGNWAGFRWLSASDILQIGTDTGGYALNLNESGNVGIGTTNPIGKLDLFAGSNNNVNLLTFSEASGVFPTFYFEANYAGAGITGNWLTMRDWSGDNVMTWRGDGNVGIGTTAPKNKLDVAGSMALGSYAGVNTAPSNSLIVSGNIGINSTTPNYRLSISSSTADVINVGGGFVSGLNSTPINRDQAIPLGYLQDNYTPSSTINSTLFWGGSLSGNIYSANTGNVGIGKTNPATKLDVAGDITGSNIYAPSFENFRQTSSLTNKVIGPDATQIAQSPVSGFIWHDIFAFNKMGVPTFETSVDGNSWTAGTLDKRLFSHIENQSLAVLDASSLKAVRWTWNSGIAWSMAQWLTLAYGYTNPAVNATITIDSSADGSTWTNRHTSTFTGNAAPYWLYVSPVNGDTYFRLTITSNASTGVLALSSIRLLTSRWGNQGLGSELSYPYTWDENQKVFFSNNVGIGTTSPAARLHVYGNGTYAASFTNGNVGIGTTVPGGKLEVYGGDVKINGGNLLLADIAGQTTTKLQSYNNASGLWLVQPTSQSLILADSISWDRGLSITYTAGTTGAVGGLLRIGQLTRNAATYTHGETALFTNGLERMRINSLGKVGIGSTTPSVPLSFGASTGDVIDVAGGFIIGLSSTQYIRSQAVSLGYLQDNYFSYWNPSPADSNNIYNNNLGNVGIGTDTPAAKFQLNGGLILKHATVADTDYTASTTDYIIAYSSITANRTVTLPNSLCTPGRFFVVLDESGSASASKQIIIDPEGTTKIVGQNTFILGNPYNSVYVFCGNSAWYVL